MRRCAVSTCLTAGEVSTAGLTGEVSAAGSTEEVSVAGPTCLLRRSQLSFKGMRCSNSPASTSGSPRGRSHLSTSELPRSVAQHMRATVYCLDCTRDGVEDFRAGVAAQDRSGYGPRRSIRHICSYGAPDLEKGNLAGCHKARFHKYSLHHLYLVIIL